MLTLICPGPNTPDQVPVILGTNASLFHRLAALCGHQKSETLARNLNVCSLGPKKTISPTVNEVDSEGTVGLVKWMGPGQLTIPPQESLCVRCEVDFHKPEPEGLVVVEASDALSLPQGVMFQPVIAPASAVDRKCFSLLLQNETKKEVTILKGTQLGKVQKADLASPPVIGESSGEIDPSVINFGDSPIPTAWKD